MRLGGPVTCKTKNPEEWISVVKQLGYRAAYCPVDNSDTDEVIEEYARSAKKADIVIAEVGAWNNPLCSDGKERAASIQYCQKQLALADKIGAVCCVNISGSRGKQWDGPHAENLTDETFDMIVDTVRSIIDAVKPVNTYYTLEPMPWAYPYSPDSYLKLISAIDRKHFAVHMDIVNMINSPEIFYKNGQLIKESFKKLGPYIKSCHAKDITLAGNLTVHLDEAIPGMGELDYRIFLKEINKLEPDMPIMLEHLSTEEEYLKAAEYVRKVSKELKISL